MRSRENIRERMGIASGPDRRMMPRAPPGGVARAQMVSECVIVMVVDGGKRTWEVRKNERSRGGKMEERDEREKSEGGGEGRDEGGCNVERRRGVVKFC